MRRETTELLFDAVRVPAASHFGRERMGFMHLVQDAPEVPLPQRMPADRNS
jgi:hypothetical protein